MLRITNLYGLVPLTGREDLSFFVIDYEFSLIDHYNVSLLAYDQPIISYKCIKFMSFAVNSFNKL